MSISMIGIDYNKANVDIRASFHLQRKMRQRPWNA